jgi:hypothetical protein
MFVAGDLPRGVASSLFTELTTGFSGVVTAIVLGLAGCVVVLGALLTGSRLLRQWLTRRRTALAAPARPWVLELASSDEAMVRIALGRIGALDRRHWMAIEPTVVSLLGKVRGELCSCLAGLFDERGVTARAVHDVRAGRRFGRFRQGRRARAAALLGDLGYAAAVPELCALLDDRGLVVRVAAVRALGRIGRPAAAGPLLGTLTGSRRAPSDIVAYALIQIGQAAHADLVVAIGDTDPLVRAVAIEILGRTGAVTAAGPVIGVLRADPSGDVRVRAARALGRLGVPCALAPLLAATGPGEPLALRAAAASALGDLGAAQAALSLGALLNDGSYQVAHNAAWALRYLGRAGEEALMTAMAASVQPAASHALEVLAVASIEAERRPRPRARTGPAARPGAAARR